MSTYTEQQFMQVSVKVLKNIQLSESIAQYIGYTVFKSWGDIRRCDIDREVSQRTVLNR